MAPEKVTEMVLNVDLKCSECYKKVKKVICKIPQIRDQIYDVEKNKVKVIVVCCSPEKVRDKLCYKGGGSIQSIEIVHKPPPGPPGKPDKPKPPSDKPKEPEKPKPGPDKPPAPKKPDSGPNQDVAKMVYEPVHGYPHMYPPTAYPMMGYGQSYYDQGYGGPTSFQNGYGPMLAPPPPPPCYVGFGYEYGYNGNRINNHTSNDYGGDQGYGEGCSIM